MFSHALRRQSCRHIRRQAVLSSKASTRSLSSVPQVDNEARALKTTFNLPDPAEMNAHQLTKIVATIGPTSEQEEPLKKVVNAGMKIMRLNFSHATTDEVELRLKNLALSQVRPPLSCMFGRTTLLDPSSKQCSVEAGTKTDGSTTRKFSVIRNFFGS